MGIEEQAQGGFELVFEGPADDSAGTLQRIKGVFLADLDFPIPEVQRILTEAPTTVRVAEDEAQLKFAFQRLKSAGAKVLIVKKKEDAAETDGQEFSFEFDLNEEAPRQQEPEETKPSRVYSIELDVENADPLSEVAHLLENTEDSEGVDSTSEAIGAIEAEDTTSERPSLAFELSSGEEIQVDATDDLGGSDRSTDPLGTGPCSSAHRDGRIGRFIGYFNSVQMTN